MTKAEIRAIWKKAPGFHSALTHKGGRDFMCAANVVYTHLGGIPFRPPMVEAGIDPGKTIQANDEFDGSPQERRDHMIALLDAGKLDA